MQALRWIACVAGKGVIICKRETRTRNTRVSRVLTPFSACHSGYKMNDKTDPQSAKKPFAFFWRKTVHDKPVKCQEQMLFVYLFKRVCIFNYLFSTIRWSCIKPLSLFNYVVTLHLACVAYVLSDWHVPLHRRLHYITPAKMYLTKYLPILDL